MGTVLVVRAGYVCVLLSRSCEGRGRERKKEEGVGKYRKKEKKEIDSQRGLLQSQVKIGKRWLHEIKNVAVSIPSFMIY